MLLYCGSYSASFVSENEIPPGQYCLEVGGMGLLFVSFPYHFCQMSDASPDSGEKREAKHLFCS